MTVPHRDAAQHDVTARQVATTRRCGPHAKAHDLIVETCSCGALVASQCGVPVTLPRPA
jgi:hypothetical protein